MVPVVIDVVEGWMALLAPETVTANGLGLDLESDWLLIEYPSVTRHSSSSGER